MDVRVEPGSRDGFPVGFMHLIVGLEYRDGSTERVGTDPVDGSVDVIVELRSKHGCVSLMNLSSCGSMARSSVGGSGISMTTTMSFVYVC